MSGDAFDPPPRTCSSFDCNRTALPFATRCAWCLERERQRERESDDGYEQKASTR